MSEAACTHCQYLSRCECTTLLRVFTLMSTNLGRGNISAVRAGPLIPKPPKLFYCLCCEGNFPDLAALKKHLDSQERGHSRTCSKTTGHPNGIGRGVRRDSETAFSFYGLSDADRRAFNTVRASRAQRTRAARQAAAQQEPEPQLGMKKFRSPPSQRTTQIRTRGPNPKRWI